MAIFRLCPHGDRNGAFLFRVWNIFGKYSVVSRNVFVRTKLLNTLSYTCRASGWRCSDIAEIHWRQRRRHEEWTKHWLKERGKKRAVSETVGVWVDQRAFELYTHKKKKEKAKVFFWDLITVGPSLEKGLHLGTKKAREKQKFSKTRVHVDRALASIRDQGSSTSHRLCN